MSLSEAVAAFIPDGSSVAMGMAQETLIPFAAGHEIIRQRKSDLTLIGAISDILFDQLIGGGCVRKIVSAWVGNVITGSCYNFRRAVEGGWIEIEDHSNLTLVMALKAGAMGISFMPLRTALGSDLFESNPNLKRTVCPFSGGEMGAVAALAPDTAVIHVQRADEFGNAHAWGNLGAMRDACFASRHVIISVEEIVSPDVISSDPNRVVIPGFLVDAVVAAPWGGHPSPVPGYYNRDHRAFIDYRNDSQTSELFAKWSAQWVDGVKNAKDYMDLMGKKKMRALSLKTHALSEAVDYGY
jgi:glutaconate CoA-transferase subunit A